MARWSRYNNPNRKKRYKKRISREDADIFATKMMVDNMRNGIDLPLVTYDAVSDALCGKESRNIY